VAYVWLKERILEYFLRKVIERVKISKAVSLGSHLVMYAHTLEFRESHEPLMASRNYQMVMAHPVFQTHPICAND
jgi:hypothetical protein